jgi:hypothetical protein
VGGGKEKVAQIMYIHVSKCKNDKIKCFKKTKARRILKYKAERRNK